jgi:hypothetical protein
MDDIVRAAMAKWPNVPAVYGWLELTARGEWRIKGEPVDNEASATSSADYMMTVWPLVLPERPQRAYVSLAATPIVTGRRVCALQSHTGVRPQEPRSIRRRGGRPYLETDPVPVRRQPEMLQFAERIVIDGSLDEPGRAGSGEATRS